MMRKKTPRDERRTVDLFNLEHAIGTEVRYWTGIREGNGKLSRTRTSAELLGGHTAVVWIEDRPDCIALTHIEVVGTGLS